jgi:hypothetical protein
MPGVALRLFKQDGLVDVTAQQFGQSPVYTDATGVFERYYPESAAYGLSPAVHVVRAYADGYVVQQQPSTPDFTGVGSFTFYLSVGETTDTAEIEPLESGFVCPMYAVELEVPAQASYSPWEIIEATVTDERGASSIIEVPVIGGFARVNAQARLLLDPIVHLVGDDQTAIVDPDFSRHFTINLASLTESGRVELTNEFSLTAANLFPDGDTNDLTSFTNEAGLARWITPWREVPKFQGHYADAMIWLTQPGSGGYVLRTQFLNINRAVIDETTDFLAGELVETGKALRVRIPEPIAGAWYALMTIEQGEDVQTEPLTVRYVNG